jgi:VanZ family protein
MRNSLYTSILTYRKSILWTVFICLLLFIPGDKLPKQEIFQIHGLDKVIHFGLFLLLEWLLLYDSLVIKIIDKPIEVLRITLIALGFCVLTELIQRYLIPERMGDINDLLMDLIGLFAGILSYRVFYWIIYRFSRPKS